jgi:hypothetical protein
MAITNGKQLECLECKAPFAKKTYQQKFCQISCQIKNRNRRNNAWRVNNGKCARCNKSLLGKRGNAIYCSKTCKSMDHNFKHRSGTRVEGIARRREIYDRDNGSCYVCFQNVDFTKFELDHLIPVNRGGDNSATNLAIACSFCNKSRGDRIGIRQLKKLSELRSMSEYH